MPGIGCNLGLAIANTSGTSTTVTITLSDTAGNSIEQPVVLSLANGQQMSRFLSELLPAGTINGGFQGNLLISSSQPVSIIGLNFAKVAFSTLPVSGPANSNSSNPLSIGSNPIVLPQFAQSGGVGHHLSLVNTSTTNATGKIALFDPSGNPLSISWNGSSASVFK